MFEQNKSVLVTGGTGLVGKALEEVIKEQHPDKLKNWVFLSSKDGDLRDFEATKRIFEKYKPAAVIHLAADVGGVFKNMAHQAEMFSNNMKMNQNILECSHNYNVKKVISCLSTCIFPDKTSYPITEEMVHNGPPHDSNYGYAYAKRMLDIQNRFELAHLFGCQFTSIIPTNIYGPHDNFHLEDSHVIPGLIHKCHLAKSANVPNLELNQPFVISGTGKPLRQFIFSKDLAKLIIWTLEEYNQVDPIILSVDEKDEVSIKQVAEAIAKEFNYTEKLIFDSTKADGQFKKTASNAKLRKLYPNFKFTDFNDGVRQTVKWFLENPEKVRK